MSVEDIEDWNGRLRSYLANLKKDSSERRQNPEVIKKRTEDLQNIEGTWKDLLQEHLIKVENKSVSSEVIDLVNDLKRRIESKIREIKKNYRGQVSVS